MAARTCVSLMIVGALALGGTQRGDAVAPECGVSQDDSDASPVLVGTGIPALAQQGPGTVRFELHHQYLIVAKGSIGPLHDLSFLIDTGATRTMVDRKIADGLSLKRRRELVLNFDRSVAVEGAEVPDVRLGPLEAMNMNVMVGDLGSFSEFADGIDAVIGLDLLRQSQDIRIDYRAHQLVFAIPGDRGGSTVRQPQVFTARVPVQDQTMLLVVDTGLEGMLLYDDRLRAHVPHVELINRISGVHEGRLTGQRAIVPGIRLETGGRLQSALIIHRAPPALDADIDGYLGTTALGAAVVELDFRANILRWW